MAGPETLSDKPKPDAAKTSASADDAASYVGTPAVGTSKAAAMVARPRTLLVWQPLVRRTAKSTAGGGV